MHFTDYNEFRAMYGLCKYNESQLLARCGALDPYIRQRDMGTFLT